MAEDDKDVEELEEGEGPIPQEVLEKLSPPTRTIIREMGMFAGPMGNPLAKKITSEHIDQLIKNDARETENSYKLQSSNRYFVLGYVILAILVFAWLTVWFSDTNPDLYIAILSHFGAVVAGFGAGWGFNKIKD